MSDTETVTFTNHDADEYVVGHDEPPPQKKKGPIRSRNRQRPVTLKQLKKYKSYLEALSNVKNEKHLYHILHRMRNDDFRMICNCMHDFLYDEGLMQNYFSPDEAKRLKHIVQPWSKPLAKFTSQKTSIGAKKKMLAKKQKGGSAILAAVIGSLLPMAVNAIGKLFQKKK